mgnify:CR=1 FL=1
MGGELGEITDNIINDFNASQDKYEVKGVYKGNYDEAMTAAIAAFRANSTQHHPDLRSGHRQHDGRQGCHPSHLESWKRGTRSTCPSSCLP